ncbi:MAG: hypothetical protein KDD82_15345 [Planctomycetes bacterium]|nr:hypothetical protein [Planctomycetota bacterium]
MIEHVVELGSELPQDVEALVTLRDSLASTPQGAAAVFVAALLVYVEDRAKGIPCLTLVMDRGRLTQGSNGYKGFEPGRQDLRDLDERVGSKPYLARSYVAGTTPSGEYRLPSPPFQVKVREQPHDVQAERAKVFVWSSGADSPRPLTLIKNNRGLWKATNWSSLTVGIRPPAAPLDDDL